MNNFNQSHIYMCLKRTLFSIPMLIALALGLFMVIHPCLNYFYIDNNFVNNKYHYLLHISLTSGGFLIFAPIVSTLPSGSIFSEDYNSGFLKAIVVRCGVKKYCRTTIISSSLVGGIVTTLPVLVLSIISIVYGRPFIAGISKTDFIDTPLVVWEPVLNGLAIPIIITLLAFLFGFTWTSIALALSTAYPNRYITLCAPFVLFFLSFVALSRFDLTVLSPANTIMPDYSGLPSLSFIFIYQLVLIILSQLIYFYGVNRRICFG